MDNPPQGINKVCTCIGTIDTDSNLKKHDLEAEKRLKKVEKDYLHASQKYTEARLQSRNLNREKWCAISHRRAAETLMNCCNNLVESIQETLDKLPTEKTKEVIDHVTNTMIMINNFLFNGLDYDQSVNDLLKEARKKRVCRGKDLSNVAPVCNPTSHDSLRKSVEQELVVLKKLFKEVQKDIEEKLHIEQCAINVYECTERKVKHLEVKKEQLSGQRDILRLNISRC
ncbi:unnamed protein product [Eruca vesicaria subsp. sativa]|uniref:Uncharacterized protein n=1 Tax=Eruca vesicaria subsp. sativa TaxID=29727 RepID=A0ABC8KUJ7_ERUVS|nr:unnamed protein product [Eruca vesicaria subsp. sativa]